MAIFNLASGFRGNRSEWRGAFNRKSVSRYVTFLVNSDTEFRSSIRSSRRWDHNCSSTDDVIVIFRENRVNVAAELRQEVNVTTRRSTRNY